MKWREFIAGVGGSVAWPAVARAQRLVGPVLGYLSGGSCDRAGLAASLNRPGGNITGMKGTIPDHGGPFWIIIQMI